MNTYIARLSDTSKGAALTIKTGLLHDDDQLSIEMANGKRSQARIERLSSEEIAIDLGSARLVCRPWHYGDKTIARFPGDNSAWTVIDSTDALEAA